MRGFAENLPCDKEAGKFGKSKAAKPPAQTGCCFKQFEPALSQ